MEINGAYLKKRTRYYIINQSLKCNPQGNREVGRPKSPWKSELQNELKNEINKALNEASTVAACAWSTLLEINSKDDSGSFDVRLEIVMSAIQKLAAFKDTLLKQ